MKKFLIALSLCSVLPFLSPVHAASCPQVSGKWSGNWYAYGYNCSVYGEGFNSGDDIYFNFRLVGCYNLRQSFAMSGHCHDGQVLLANNNAVMTGMIVTNQLNIQGNNQQAYLYKYSS